MKRVPLAALCLLAFSLQAAAAARRAELVYDGNLVQRTDLLTLRDKHYLPLKSVAAMFRGKTQWYPVANRVVLQVNNHKLTFTIDSALATVGERKIGVGAPIRYVGGTVFAPVDFFLGQTFAEITECKVSWDGSAPALLAQPRVTLLSPRVYSRGDRTRVVLECKEEFAPAVSGKEGLVLVDIPDARIAEEETLRVKDGVLESVQLLRARRGALLKISLAQGVTDYAHVREKDDSRIVVEFRNPRPDPALARKEFAEFQPPGPAAAGDPPAAPQAERQPVPRAAGQPARVRKIVVDAGHGGKDPGAIGRMGTKEKEINLMIALELARVLRMEGGYEVVLTRSEDVFIPLTDRSGMANQEKADLFISIHCNASLRKTEGGFEIYFLAEDASDPHAEATAEFENTVIELEDDAAKNRHLQELLSSLARTEFINESSLLCHTIHQAVKKGLPLPTRGVKQADFHVLHGVEMPSVLVETAFITHAPEEKKLRKRKFRSAVVDAILSGVQNYEKQVALLKGG